MAVTSIQAGLNSVAAGRWLRCHVQEEIAKFSPADANVFPRWVRVLEPRQQHFRPLPAATGAPPARNLQPFNGRN